MLHAQAIIVFTLGGGTARMMAAPHPMVPIFAFTSRLVRARRLMLLRGTYPFLIEKNKDFLEDLDELFATLKKRKLVKKNDRVVITAGLPIDIPSWTNVLRVEVVP